jgi:UDP-N-acetylmuramoyl-L-alanyl-D-glutamate--2,6-diaminopimelate ligase
VNEAMAAALAPLPKPAVKPITLGAVLAKLGELETNFLPETSTNLPEFTDVEICGVTHDSNQVNAGEAFFALPGLKVHGASYVGAAIQRGAAAIVTDQVGYESTKEITDGRVPVLVSRTPRDLLGHFAAIVYGEPAKELSIIGVTGTNGKTTTAWFVSAIAEAAGIKSASIGTTGVHLASQSWGLARTTPEASELQAALAFLVQAGVKAVAMEVSSHALALGRVNGVWFKRVGFTGLSQDHLDFHQDMNSYFRAKASLFTKTYSNDARVVADAWGEKLLAETKLKSQVVALAPRAAHWQIRTVEHNTNGVTYRATTPEDEDIRGALGVWGTHNALNAVLSVALTDWLDLGAQARADALALVQVPGRMQITRDVSGVVGVVDYAHTPDAISRSITAARTAAPAARVWVVFGAGGNRDRSKRPDMAIAALEADMVLVTDDNPRDEPPEVIRKTLIDSMVTRAGKGVLARVQEVPDRRLAIRAAISKATSGDVVLVLGKGHETGQEKGGVITPFDDAYEITQAFIARGSGALSGAA